MIYSLLINDKLHATSNSDFKYLFQTGNTGFTKIVVNSDTQILTYPYVLKPNKLYYICYDPINGIFVEEKIFIPLQRVDAHESILFDSNPKDSHNCMDSECNVYTVPRDGVIIITKLVKKGDQVKFDDSKNLKIEVK